MTYRMAQRSMLAYVEPLQTFAVGNWLTHNISAEP